MTRDYYGQEPDHHPTARDSGRPQDPREKVIKQLQEWCDECEVEHHSGVDCDDVDSEKQGEPQEE